MKTILRNLDGCKRTIYLSDSNRTICYIDERTNGISVNTGKPSDSEHICWKYGLNERIEAERTAIEFYNNYTRKIY